MKVCDCYRAEKNFLGKVGTCWGTAERDACSCGGDKSKCDFYPSVREEEMKPTTNADRLRAMTDEELAKFMANIEPCRESAWLDWLRQEAQDES